MSEYKYRKYKEKYIKLKLMQTGGNAKIILLDGVSSSGKTTLCQFYEAQGYHRIASDDFRMKARKAILSSIPNEYINKRKMNELVVSKLSELMFVESKKYDNVIIDDISQGILKFIPDICVIIVYAPLSDLVRNMINRKTTEPRGIYIFNQFAKKYTKSLPNNKIIDTINRKNFIELLKKMKYEFESEKELIEFATKIFALMDIDDDKNHAISLRNDNKYYYIVNTHDKSPKQVYNKIKKQTDKFDIMTSY
jgi:hypothetical protein